MKIRERDQSYWGGKGNTANQHIVIDEEKTQATKEWISEELLKRIALHSLSGAKPIGAYERLTALRSAP